MPAMNRWIRTLAIVAMGAVVLSAAPSLAQTWPQRTVRLIVPVGAGNVPDVPARLFADRLAERWKQPVVVENRPGADALIATAAFASMRDDHTLFVSFAGPISVLPLLHDKLPYDPGRDLVPISTMTDAFAFFAASASLKIGSLTELVTYASAHPGKLNYHAAPGAFPILFGGFMKSAGLDMTYVPYRDTPPAVQDLAEGRIQVMLSAGASNIPLVRAGKIKLLAVTNKQRAPIAPEVPTVAEAGFPDLTYEGFSGFFGPGDISPALRDRIAADIRAVATDPAIADRLAPTGLVVRASTPAEFAAAIEEQRAKMAAIVKLIGKPAQ